MGDSASLLSNHPSDRHRSKYQIIHTLRIHMASDNRSYNCVFQQDNDQNIIDISISKDLMKVVGQVLKSHITSLAPLVLPVSKKLKFLVTFVGSKVLRLKIKAYVLNCKLPFEHFCIQTGGKTVLDTMLKRLELQERIKKDDRIWQLAFGSGFKCNSAVLVALNNVESGSLKNPWRDDLPEFHENIVASQNF
ncbi:hypothetical protein K1719_035775 [Acacia pycnantha]|nr:hypothetical protein K1719_035775 [Acacia pycnantha]